MLTFTHNQILKLYRHGPELKLTKRLLYISCPSIRKRKYMVGTVPRVQLHVRALALFIVHPLRLYWDVCNTNRGYLTGVMPGALFTRDSKVYLRPLPSTSSLLSTSPLPSTATSHRCDADLRPNPVDCVILSPTSNSKKGFTYEPSSLPTNP